MISRRLEGRVVIATHNAGKLKEMRELLAPFGVEAVSAGELDLPEPDETGVTFAENAFIKAHAAAMKAAFPLLRMIQVSVLKRSAVIRVYIRRVGQGRRKIFMRP